MDPRGPQCLLGDVGGTNIRLTLVPAAHLTTNAAPLPTATHHARYRTADFKHLREALAKFAKEKPAELGHIVSCALSVCGPVNNGTAILLAATFGPDGWTIEEADLAAALGLKAERLKMANDFVAVGLAVGSIDPQHLITVHEGAPQPRGVVAVIGPGTGLGSCFGVYPSGAGGLQIFPSEGGESDFVARTADQWALRSHIQKMLVQSECAAEAREVAHVKVEHVVSGSALSTIYHFLKDGETSGPTLKRHKAGDEPTDAELAAASVHAQMDKACSSVDGDPSAIVAAHGTPGEPGSDPTCVAALDLFIDCLGAECANLALRFQALGGVYIAGGVANKLAERLSMGGSSGRLRTAYLSKGKSTEAYSSCPLRVVAVEGDDLALEGVWRFAQSEMCGFRLFQS